MVETEKLSKDIVMADKTMLVFSEFNLSASTVRSIPPKVGVFFLNENGSEEVLQGRFQSQLKTAHTFLLRKTTHLVTS